MSSSMVAPVVLIGFNRPKLTRRVVERLLEAQRPKVYFVSDGPRLGNENDFRLIDETRRLIDLLSGDCEAIPIWSMSNMGCRHRIQSGLDQVFALESRAIIIEDDCFPDLTFFSYCDELLERYEHNPLIGAVNGTNYGMPEAITQNSYSFSAYPSAWGWATWARTWNAYDPKAQSWSSAETRAAVRSRCHSKQEFRHWDVALRKVQKGFDTWDYQLSLAFLANGLLSTVPRVNLITNNGFGSEGTHTTSTKSTLSAIPTVPLVLPLSHPESVTQNTAFDASLSAIQYSRSFGKVLRHHASTARNRV